MVATYCEYCSGWKSYHPLSWLDTVTWRDFCWLNYIQIKLELKIRNISNQKNKKKSNSGAEGCDMNILSWVLLNYTRANSIKRRKDVNQGGHVRDFKLSICLNGVGVSLEITSPASWLCKFQLVCRRLQGLTPYVHCMAPADGLCGVHDLMSLHVKTILKAKQHSKWRHKHPRYNKATTC